MKRRNVLKDDEAVSPVIATILMVAITVVLAATLYMMLPGADDAGTPVSGNISADVEEIDGEDESNVTITFSTMGTPSRPAWDSLEIYIDGDLVEGYTDDHFSFLTADGQVRSGSSLTLTDEITYTGDWSWDSDPDEVVVFFDGYDGSLRANF